MKNQSRVVSVVCMLALVVSLLTSMPVYAEETEISTTPGDFVYRNELWNDQVWQFESVINENGVPVEVSYVNDNGNMMLEANNVRLSGYRRAIYPPNDADGCQTDENDILAVLDGDDTNRNNDAFDINWRMRIQNYTEFSVNWYQGNAEFHFMEGNTLVVRTSPSSATSKMIEVPFGDEWHDWSLRVRGLTASIFYDGELLYTYQLFRQPASWRYISFRQSYEYDFDSVVEVEYLKVIDKRGSGVNILKPQIWDSKTNFENLYYEGEALTFEADAGAEDGEKKTVEFFANGVKIGSAVDQGKITTGGGSSGGCKGSGETETDPAHNAIITLDKGLPAGRYNITAKCGNDVSSETVLYIHRKGSGELACPESAEYGEVINLGINDAAAKFVNVEYFIDGKSVGVDAPGNNFALTEVCIGTHRVTAKLFEADGTTYDVEGKELTVSATGENIINAKFNREYQLDYTVDNGGAIEVNDGYFTLSMTHSDDTVTYVSTEGTETYNNLGDGEYRIVTTGGYAEVYYDGRMAFTFRMPYTGKAECAINHSGGVDVKSLGGTGVKATRFHKNLDDLSVVEEYGVDMGTHYSVEFDKNDTAAQRVMVYDGTYEVVMQMDGNGITVNTQSSTSYPTTKTVLSDELKSGYYRITVTAGMAQLFVDNKCIGSFRCPINPHRKAVLMKTATSDTSTFVAVKNTDDIYFYNEDFDGNGEGGYSFKDYWYNQEEYFVLGEGEEYTLNYEVEDDGTDKHLSLSGNGDYILNVNADDPVIKWKGSYSGDGTFEAKIRNYRNFGYLGAYYDGATGMWSLRVSNPFSVNKTAVDGTTSKVTEGCAYEVTTASYPLGTGEHEFEFSAVEDSMTFRCDGQVIMETNRLGEIFTIEETVGDETKKYEISNNRTHGRVGFAVNGGKLNIDDFSYSGDGTAAPGVVYSNLKTNFDVYKNHKGQVVGAANDYASPILISDDNGLTWNVTYASKTGKGKLSGNNLNLDSGKFLRVQYQSKDDVAGNALYSYALLFNEGTNTEASRVSIGGKMVELSDNRVMIEPDGSMEGIPYSGMGTRLIQLKNGPYKGRVLYTRGGSGEKRGTGLLYYSDDYKDPNFEGNPVWHEPNIQLSYDSTGGLVLETQCVEMPDGTVRCYVRSDKGFLTYFESFDGGATWDPTQRKVEDLFSSSCCFSIMRVGDTETYCAFWEYELLTTNLRYYNRPRNRASLAISYDGMKTWEFIGDMEELNWGNGGLHCNNTMRYLDGAMYMGYLDQSGLPEMSMNYRQDLSKVKPLKRFTEAHERNTTASSGMVYDFTNEYAVIPKVTGEAMIYGDYIHADVNENGYADAIIVAKAVGATSSVNENGVVLTMGETTVEFTNSSSDYVMNGTKIAADYVLCENGYLNPRVSEIFGKYVLNGNDEYAIMSASMTDFHTTDVIQTGISASMEASEVKGLMADVNAASEAGDGEGIEVALGKYSDALTFIPDLSDVSDKKRLFDNMTGIKYFTVADIETVFKNAKLALISSVRKESAVAVSTVSEGFEKWGIIGTNSGGVTVEEGVAEVTVKSENGKPLIYGTHGTELPENGFNFVFDYSFDNENAVTSFKIGNGDKEIYFTADSSKVAVYTGDKTLETDVDLKTDTWYTFKGSLNYIEEKATVNMYITDAGSMDVMVCEGADIIRSSLLKGFRIEADGNEKVNIRLKNVRIYEGKAIDVITYSTQDGKATATVDFLNDGDAIDGVWIDEDFESTDVIFDDRKPFYQSPTTDAEYFDVEVRDGSMYYFKSINGTNPFSQNILLPTPTSVDDANEFVFEYDMMIPDSEKWQEGAHNFMYFDLFLNHPAKPLRQTILLKKDRVQVGYSPYVYSSIFADENGEYEGKWMSFKHHYIFDGTDWKCNFYYKKQSGTQWNVVENAAMSSSTTSSSYIRLYSYGDMQTEVCFDNIKVYSLDDVITDGTVFAGVYNDDRQAGIGCTEMNLKNIGAYDSRRYSIDAFEYDSKDGRDSYMKFFIWNLDGRSTPLTETVKIN